VGGVISPVLSNLTLDGLERVMRDHFPKTPKRANQGKVNFVRYADDFIVTGRSKDLLEQEVRPLIEQFLRERGLELSPEKTVVTHIRDGFDFLGFNVRKYANGKLLIKPSKKSVKALLWKVREITTSNKQLAAWKLVRTLTPILRGWALYYQQSVSKATYTFIDRAVFQTVWRWAKRRHPKKGARWVKAKYFHRIGNRDWIFYGQHDGKVHNLFRLTSVRIVRHAKIKGEANPYDPAWEVYFERRLGVKMGTDLFGRRQLLRLWKEQEGICPVCEQKMTELTGWHNHHIVWRVLGGSDRAENRVLLHPNCHQQVHANGLTISKPGSR
jgi:RNA-directed DNA polymerase